jgi:hypothetical protein
MGQKHREQQRPCCKKSKDSSTTAYEKSWTSDGSTKSEAASLDRPSNGTHKAIEAEDDLETPT